MSKEKMAKTRIIRRIAIAAAAVMALSLTAELSAEQMKVKHLARLRGVRPNQLIGYGLVAGLQRTGDSQRMAPTFQSLSNMLKHFGTKIDPQNFKAKNVAAVMVTANLPAFLQPGAKIDVTVSAIGDARSLQGGTLLLTPLLGANREIYAVAQGNLSIGGFDFEGEDFLIRKNQSSVGFIPNGAIVEREVKVSMLENNQLVLFLDSPDFTTAARLARVINNFFEDELAQAEDAGKIVVHVPFDYRADLVPFISSIENLYLEPERVGNKVVVSERTGTVVIGKDVRIDAIAVAHGDLNVLIKRQYKIIKSAKFGMEELSFETEIITDKKEEEGKLIIFPEGANLIELVDALNVVGASPRDMIAILQAIKKAGALRAELEII